MSFFERVAAWRRLLVVPTIGFVVVVGFAASADAADLLVATQAELISALGSANPGDTILLRNGIWNNLNIGTRTVNGTLAAPINIRAQTPGQVTIATSYVFGLAGSNYTVSGLTFKDDNDQLKSIRFRGTNVRVYDNAFLMGGQYNQITWDVQDSPVNPTGSFDHNFLAGKQDRGCSLVLDGSLYPQIKNNYFGFRPSGGPDGHDNGWETIRIGNSGIMTQTIGANIERNYFEGAEGEAETISDKTQNNRIANNTFRNIAQGWVTARHGGNGVYENNQFFNTLGIRIGNDEDTVADHPNLTIRNNYLEGPNEKFLVPGYQSGPKILNNTVYVGTGSYAGESFATGKYPLEYNATTGGTIAGNLMVINDPAYGAVRARTLGGVTPTATGSNNIAFNQASGTNVFGSGTPAGIQGLFTVANPNFVRDEYNILRPATGPGAGLGYSGSQTALARNSLDLGPSWLSPAMRINKFTVGEFQFNGDLDGGAPLASTANNTGYLATPAIFQNSGGTPTNLHSADAIGVSGLAGDRAFDNRSAASMGAAGGKSQVADRTWFRDLQAFTLAGWFKTDGAQTVGGNASLVEQIDANGGWSLKSTTAGKLTLSIGDGSTTRTSTSPNASYNQQNQWVFFAVTFDKRPGSNEVSFYMGTDTTQVSLVGQASNNSANTSDTVAAPVTIGNGFDGLIDNLRIFGVRRNITWVDEDDLVYTNTDINNFTHGLLGLAELRSLRAYDLRLPMGDVNASRSVNAADIDLVMKNFGNGLYDIDGDLDNDRADAGMLIQGILDTNYGDANLDQHIDTLDFNSLAAAFGAVNQGWASGDSNADGSVDTTDFNVLASNFGQVFATDAGASIGSTVPEPSSLGLLIGASIALKAHRFRRRVLPLESALRR